MLGFEFQKENRSSSGWCGDSPVHGLSMQQKENSCGIIATDWRIHITMRDMVCNQYNIVFVNRWVAGTSNNFATYPITKKTTATSTEPVQQKQQHCHRHTYVFNYRFIYSTLDGSLQLMKFLLYKATDTDTDTDTVIDALTHALAFCMRQWNAPLKIHGYYDYRFNFSSCTAWISSSSERNEEEYQCCLAFWYVACIYNDALR